MIQQYDIALVDLNPTRGSEISKTRPCVIISPNEMNEHLRVVVLAPMTSSSKNYPTRIPVNFNEKDGWIVIDQIRTVDKSRIVKVVGHLKDETAEQVKRIIKETFVD